MTRDPVVIEKIGQMLILMITNSQNILDSIPESKMKKAGKSSIRSINQQKFVKFAKNSIKDPGLLRFFYDITQVKVLLCIHL